MRRALCSPSATALLLPTLLGGCGNSTTGAPVNDGGGGSDATSDAGAPIDAGVQPDAATCSGDPSTCLFGTAQTSGFIVTPTRLRATLHRVFPSGGATEVDSQIVAKDQSWAFSGLATWAHYYVQIQPGFPADAGVRATVATRVGPLAVPNRAGALMVLVKPVQLDVLEGSATGAAMQVESALAHVFNPATGDEIVAGASVSIVIGTTSTPMAWTTYAPKASAYYVKFATPPPAQPSYQITTSLPDPGATQNTWNLVASPPTFTAAITSPTAGATVPVNMDLVVTWPAQSEADYYVVEWFASQNGGWTGVYTSPRYDAWDQDGGPNAFTATVPKANLTQAGKYLLNVAFTKANCPATADGCVHASAVANEQITVQ